MPLITDPNKEPEQPQLLGESEDEKLTRETNTARLQIEHDEVFKLRDLPKVLGEQRQELITRELALDAQAIKQDARTTAQNARDQDIAARDEKSKKREEEIKIRLGIADEACHYYAQHIPYPRLSFWTNSPNPENRIGYEDDLVLMERVVETLKLKGGAK